MWILVCFACMCSCWLSIRRCISDLLCDTIQCGCMLDECWRVLCILCYSMVQCSVFDVQYSMFGFDENVANGAGQHGPFSMCVYKTTTITHGTTIAPNVKRDKKKHTHRSRSTLAYYYNRILLNRCDSMLFLPHSSAATVRRRKANTLYGISCHSKHFEVQSIG